MDLKEVRLIRIDEGAEEINISLGEAVIGRGGILGCTDKRISRNHGLIKLSEEGNVILIAQHLNPIFYTGKEKSSEIIKSGNSVTLNDGDEFSLLPDSYQYRVTVLPEVKSKCELNGCTENNLATNHESDQDNLATNHESDQDNLATNHESDQVKEEIQESEQKPEIKMNVDQVDPFLVSSNHVRVLPSWMTDSSNDTSKAGPSKGTPRGRKRTDTTKTEKTVVNKRAKVNKKKGKNNADECSDDETSDNDDKEKNEKLKKDMDVNSGGLTNTKTDQSRGKLHELSDENDDDDDVTTETDKQKDVPTGQDKLDDAEHSDDNSTTAQNAATSNTRQKCIYGANCYRKNPQHRIDFSHPGDVDFKDDDVPECPYGIACYRKNKQHRLDYKHTAAPQQANKAQTKRKRTTRKNDDYNDDDDEEDDYDFDDPFLNDASSDDYQPTDSDSENSPVSDGDDEEDTKRMLREAKKFTRKRK